MNRTAAACATIIGIVVSLWMQAAVAGTAGDAKKGAKLFDKASCAGCHPGGGNAIDPQHPLKGAKFATAFKDDAKIESLVRAGVKGTAMPAFSKAKVSDSDLKDIIAYIRTLTPKSSR